MAPRKKKATSTAKKKGPKVTKDDDGQPDIYDLVVNHGMGRAEACEHAGVGIAKGHTLLWKQEVEHNPDFAISTKGNDAAVGKRLAKERFEGGKIDGTVKLRWEQLAARSGLSVEKVVTLIAEALGVEPEDLKRKGGGKKKATKKGKKAAPKKRGRKKKAPEPEPEDEDEDEEEPEDEEPEDEEEDEDVEDEEEEDEDEDEDEEDEEEPPAPKRRRRRKK